MARRGARPEGPLRRRVGHRRPRKTLVVFCEGRRTEPEYLEALKRDPEVREVAAVDLRIRPGGGVSTPLELVRLAVATRHRAIEEQDEIDEFWCVFDVEWPVNHPRLKEALDLARRHGVQVAVSNPCFELWLVLHSQGCTAWLTSDDARRLRRDLDGQRDKGLTGSRYMPGRAVAARRARELEQRHEREGRAFPDDNPSSGMHRLLASVAPSDDAGQR